MDQQRPKSGASTPVTSWRSTVFLTNGTRYVTNGAPDGSRSLSTYSSGRLISNVRKDALGNQLAAATYTYDPHGRQLAVSDARVGATTYAYNAADQVASVTTPAPVLGQAAQITRTYYNKLLQATNVVEPDSSSVITEFYVTGELKRNYGSRTYPVEYTYDYAGRVQTMKTWQNFASDSGAAITTWNYSGSRGWLSSKRYVNAGQGSLGPDYTYTPGGRLKTRTWARGVVTTYGYGFDDANSGNDYPELVQVDYTSDPQATPSITYTYDRRGRQATVVQSPTTVGLTYNLAGELVQESYTGGPLNGLSVTNGYDHWMRRTNVVLRSGGSSLHAASYYYDEASRLRMVASGSASAGYSYLANSPLVSQIAFTNSGVQRMVTTKQYDLLNRLENIKSVPSGSGAASFAYTYNSANQRTLRREADGSYWRYEYDALGQVVSGNKYWADGTPVAGQQFQYAFDDIGNRLSTKAGGDEYGANLRTNAYYPNLLNQYTSRTILGAADVIGVSLATNTVTVNGLVPYRKGEYFRKELTVANSSAPVWQAITGAANGQTSVSGNTWVPRTPEVFGYDSDGNLTNDGRWAYTWDAENRLRTMVPNTAIGLQSKLAFDYDARGRRIRKQVWNNPAGTGSPTNDLRFVYDGWNLIGTLNSSLSLLNSYAWGLDLSGNLQGAGGVGGLVVASEILNGVVLNSYLPAFDGNGNVAALIKAGDGTESARYEYGPFGEVIRATGPMAKANPFRWSTQYQDDETDLVMYLARPYSPSTGRWLSRDPIQEQGGLNLYGFVGNNPISRFDVLGLWWSNIHHDATKRWAIADGYPSDAAETIATWDELVDHGINAPWPIFGDQSYHFNRNRFGGPDTRLVHYTDHLGTAKRFCTASLGYDLPVPAAMQLGTGLHPLHDWVAHGDFGMHMDSIYVVHNGFSPQKEYGSPGDYPDMTWLDAVGTPDGRATSAVIHVINNAGFDYARFEPGIKRWTLTKQLTDSALAEFLGHVRNYGGCKCKSYFGVQ